MGHRKNVALRASCAALLLLLSLWAIGQPRNCRAAGFCVAVPCTSSIICAQGCACVLVDWPSPLGKCGAVGISTNGESR